MTERNKKYAEFCDKCIEKATALLDKDIEPTAETIALVKKLAKVANFVSYINVRLERSEF